MLALGSATFCTTKDKDYNEEDLPNEFADPGTSVTGTTTTSTTGTTGGSPTCNGTVCTPYTVEQALILDFEDDGSGAGGAAGAAGAPGLGSFARPEYLRGIFKYPNEFAQSFEDGAWHLSGSVGQGSGFGLEFDCETDASAYSGIEFTLRGDAGTNQINMLVETASNIQDACKGGTCSASCMAPAAAVNHPGGEETYTFLWEDFQDGSPDDTPDPGEITAIRWEFQGQGSFPVDFYVDDIRFVK